MNKKLLLAADKGDATTVIECLINGADVHAVDANGRTALLAAARNGHTATVEALIARGADVNAANANGNTALLLAACDGHTATVEALIARGADLNAANANGDTALLLAACNGHTATVKALIARGADLNAANANGNTALIQAARNGHTATVEALIARGADLNAANANGNTALLLAAGNDRTATVGALIASGACTKVVNKRGETALNLVSGNNTGPLINLLTGGLEALQRICRLRNQKILKVMIKNINVDLITLIISFDRDLAFEDFPQYSLYRLKASITPKMLSVSSGNNLISNMPVIAVPEEETKGCHETMIVRFSAHSSSSSSNHIVSYLHDAITPENIPQVKDDVEETEETKVQQDYPVALPAISETLLPFDEEFQMRFVLAESLRELNNAMTLAPAVDLSSSSPAYYAALSSSTNATSTTTSTVTIVETPEERRRQMDAALQKRGL